MEPPSTQPRPPPPQTNPQPTCSAAGSADAGVQQPALTPAALVYKHQGQAPEAGLDAEQGPAEAKPDAEESPDVASEHLPVDVEMPPTQITGAGYAADAPTLPRHLPSLQPTDSAACIAAAVVDQAASGASLQPTQLDRAAVLSLNIIY